MKKLYFCLIIALLILAACGRQNGDDTENEALVEATAATPTMLIPPTAVPTRTPAPTATATATPAPLVPAVTANDQLLGEDGRLQIDRVVAPEPGWLVIHNVDGADGGVVLGYTAVAEGETQDIVVTLDPFQAGATLLAALYLQENGLAEDEDPGLVLDVDTAVASTPFAVDVQVTWPAIMVSNQAVADDGLVRVDSVTTTGPGWLLLYTDRDGAPDEMLGYVHLDEGLTEALAIAMDWRRATPHLHAALYHDEGRPGRFDPEVDLPVMARGNQVMAPFDVTLPFDIFVLDQPVVDGTIVIERVISNGPGWVVVFFNDDGRPARIIGQAFLEDGLNEQVVVPVLERALTSILFVTLHEDTGVIGEFEFPVADPPAFYNDRIPDPVSLRIDGGSYLIARDQSLGDGDTLIVPLVVASEDAWVVVRTDTGGTPGESGELLGYTWIPAGVNRDVVVEVDAARLIGDLQVVLHQDAGEPQQFEPADTDLPFLRNRNIVWAPFTYREE